MSALELRYEDTKRALNSLRDILREKFSVIVRDAAIQRFEYTVEAFWKYLQIYLKEFEGIECNSPKSCIRSVHSVMLWNEDKTVQALEMIDDRNLTSHTYHEEVANNIYSKLNDYYQLMDNLLSRTKSA